MCDPRRTCNRRTASPAHRRRQGSVYILVLAVGVNVMLIGLAAIYLARVRLRDVESRNELRQARLLARSSVEQAVGMMNNYTAGTGKWRDDYVSGEETLLLDLGGGQMSFKLVDGDGDLADDPTDSLWVYGIGRAGNAVWVERARARVDGGRPFEFFRTTIHCQGSFSMPTGTQLTVVGAPASTDGVLGLDGTIVGDAEAVTVSGTGSATGTLTSPVEHKGMPLRTLFDAYVARATALTHVGSLNRIVLSPGVNEYSGSGLNENGVYYINTGGSDLEISDIRLYGTLVVDAGGGQVTISTSLLEPYREDFPTLIVKGRVNVNYLSPSLVEGPPIDHNFNPPGTPYRGVSDGDMTDVYVHGLFGLIHVIGDLTLTNACTSKGVFVVDGRVTVAGQSATITHDPKLMLNPPLGYTEDPNSTAMILSSGSWSRQPAP